MARVPFQWNNANFAWEANPFPNQSITPFTWDDCALITEIVQAIAGGGGHYDPSRVWKDQKKKRQFIKLLCKVEGKEYEESKEVVNRTILISDIALVAKEVLGVNIKVEV